MLAFIGIAIRFTIFVVEFDDVGFGLLEIVESLLIDRHLRFLVGVFPNIAFGLGMISSKVNASLGAATFAIVIGVVTAHFATVGAFDDLELMLLLGLGTRIAVRFRASIARVASG